LKKILVIYYTQTGQLKRIIDSVLSDFSSSDFVIDYLEIKPQPAFPFPWSYDEFFEVFPECVKGIPCEIKPIEINPNDHDLIFFAYSPWFLSPSLPAHAFLQSAKAKELLKNKPVITIIGCRNTWVMAQVEIKKYLDDCNAKHMGNIVLSDRALNLVGVISMTRWLIKGKQEKYLGIIPPAGVSEKDINEASRFSKPIIEAIKNGDFNNLQKNLLQLKSVEMKPAILMLETTGKRIFSIWASSILKKGEYKNPKRKIPLRIFKYYLIAVLFLISPFVILIFSFARLFASGRINRMAEYYRQV
jgi:hypothetical protein